jgi:hypothetical protein
VGESPRGWSLKISDLKLALMPTEALPLPYPPP